MVPHTWAGGQQVVPMHDWPGGQHVVPQHTPVWQTTPLQQFAGAVHVPPQQTSVGAQQVLPHAWALGQHEPPMQTSVGAQQIAPSEAQTWAFGQQTEYPTLGSNAHVSVVELQQ